MQSTIKDLFYGKNIPFEAPTQCSPEYTRLAEMLSSYEDNLKRKLQEEENKLYEEIISVQMRILTLTSEERFSQGFKMGGKLAIEMIYEDDLLMEKIR